jgi:hypothetical protein
LYSAQNVLHHRKVAYERCVQCAVHHVQNMSVCNEARSPLQDYMEQVGIMIMHDLVICSQRNCNPPMNTAHDVKFL